MTTTKEEQRAYQRGYAMGAKGRWPAHRPPAPPEPVVAALVAAARQLRDECDDICATLSADDDFAIRLGPRIDAIDAAMTEITAWLRSPP